MSNTFKIKGRVVEVSPVVEIDTGRPAKLRKRTVVLANTGTIACTVLGRDCDNVPAVGDEVEAQISVTSNQERGPLKRWFTTVRLLAWDVSPTEEHKETAESTREADITPPPPEPAQADDLPF